MKYLIIFLIFFCTCCKGEELKRTNNKELTVKKEEIITEKAKEADIPTELSDYLEKNLSDYKIPKIEEYIKGWQDFSSNNKTPYLCKGDFDGNGSTDYALLLISNNRLYLISFLFINKQYNHIIIDDYDYYDKKIEAILSQQQKGEWETVDEKILVPYDGVTVDFIEESETISYYWKDNKYIKVLFD
jgi:hypothetical protein